MMISNPNSRGLAECAGSVETIKKPEIEAMADAVDKTDETK